MKVGFTGTRAGMSSAQKSQLKYVLSLLRHADIAIGQESSFHYGTHESVKLKADDEAAELASEHGFTLIRHPANRGTELQRDRLLAAIADVMVAAPESDTEIVRSGTWATVRYMRKAVKPVVMLARGSR